MKSPLDKIAELQALEASRDAAIGRLVGRAPIVDLLGVRFERLGDEITARLHFDPKLIGNPTLPAIHGGVTGAFLEITAIMTLAWDRTWADLTAGGAAAEAIGEGRFAPMPKTIDITIDYLRSGRPRDVFARAEITKKGRRVANVRAEAWQDERARPIAGAHGHFMLPEPAAET